MGLLKISGPRAHDESRLRFATVVTCPYNGHQVGWCRGLCAPVAGIGHCGRPAAHALVGRTQRAIAAQLATGSDGRPRG